MTEIKHPHGSGACERILATATELFSRFGYNGVSTREIAVIAQVNETTIFRHYPRKYDLYLAVMEAGLQKVHLRGDLLTKLSQAEDGKSALGRAFELISNTLLEKPEMLRLLQYRALEHGEEVDPLVRRYLSELFEVIARYLEPWIENGELRGKNSRTLIFGLIAIIISYQPLKRLFSDGESSLEEVYEAYAGLQVLSYPQSITVLASKII